MEWMGQILSALYRNMLWVDMIFAIIIVFFERRSPKSVWAWLLVMVFLPGVGFIFYLFLGQDMHKRKMFRIKELEDKLSEAIHIQERQAKSMELEKMDKNLQGFSDLIYYNLQSSGAVLTDDNDVDIFTDGNDKFEALLEDLEQAKSFIHLEYYIIKKDELFERIVEVLERKVAQGVEVRVLFDAMGSRTVRHSYWKQLRKKGIRTAEFFPAILGRFQLRINYRNHRKIVVIDNKVAYVGGFNVGKEYIDRDPKFGHWRDTHLRIQGTAVMSLQLRFILDWNYAAKEDLLAEKKLFEGLELGKRDQVEMQIVSSGPDNTLEQIRDNYLRLFAKAKEHIYIQTPYFIPDDTLLDTLLLAIRSGVEVNLMIPCMQDHPFIYWATYSYVGELVRAGANCYTYDKGFLHAKGVCVDGKAFCYGTANMDIRSFALNFEVNAVVYDKALAEKMEAIFREDLKDCTHITKELYESRSLPIRIKEQFCRLLSPLL